jgi:hypothetical protein
MSDLTQLPSALIGAVRSMDAEAARRMDLAAAGPSSDLFHARIDQELPQSDLKWSHRLAQFLSHDGYDCRPDVRFPTYAVSAARRRQRCDLVIQLAQDARLWLEVRAAWKDDASAASGIYQGLLLHPLLDGYDFGKGHATPEDFQRLNSLQPPDAQYVASMLVGFEQSGSDSLHREILDLDKLAKRDGWSSSNEAWQSPFVDAQTICVWLWVKPMSESIDHR